MDLRFYYRALSCVLGLTLGISGYAWASDPDVVPGNYWVADGHATQYGSASAACAAFSCYVPHTTRNYPDGIWNNVPNAIQCTDPDLPSSPCMVVRHYACGIGQTFDIDLGACTGEPMCEPDEIVNPLTAECTHECEDFDPFTGLNLCEPPPDIPDCDPDTEALEAITVGSETTYHCVPVLELECYNPSGYFNGRQICDDDKDDCEATGGTYGFVQGKQVCLPSDYDDQLPECDSSGVVHLVNGGFVCETPKDEESEDTPNKDEPDTDGDGIPNSQDPDIDGDGIPNWADDDIDGDGIPNGQDDDVDGDGIPNSDDPDIDGDGINNERDNDDDGDGIEDGADTDSDGDGIEDPNDPTPDGTEEYVEGGGTCKEEPNCKGDAIQCAILYQAWKTRCQGELDETFPELSDLGLDGLSGSDLAGDDTDLQTILSGVFNQTGAAGSCPTDQTFTVGATQVPVPWLHMCDYATLIRPMVILVFGFFGFRMLMRAF